MAKHRALGSSPMYMWLWIECRFAACWKWKQAFTLRTSWQHFHRSFLITIRVCKRAFFTFLHKNAIPLAHAELTGTLKNNKPYVAVLAPAQWSSQCIYFNKIGKSSTVKPHSRPIDHCGFWSQAMSPLITWPPSSALRRLQEGFVILCFDLFVTSPRQIPPSLPSCQVQSNF